MRRYVRKLIKNYNGTHYAYTNQQLIDGKWEYVNKMTDINGEDSITWYATKEFADVNSTHEKEIDETINYEQ